MLAASQAVNGLSGQHRIPGQDSHSGRYPTVFFAKERSYRR
jgi:hypothetical protein